MVQENKGEIPTDSNPNTETLDIVDDPYFQSDGTYESAIRGTNFTGKPISETKGQEFLFPIPNANEPEINKPPENLLGKNDDFRQGIVTFNGMAANLQRAKGDSNAGKGDLNLGDNMAIRASAIAVNSFLVNTIRDFGVNSQYVTDKESFHQFFQFFGGAEVTDLVQNQGFKFSNIQKEMAIDSLSTYYFRDLLGSLKNQAQEVIPILAESLQEVDLNDKAPAPRFSREDIDITYENGSIFFVPRKDAINPRFAKSQVETLNQNYSETLSTILRMFSNITGESFEDTWSVWGASLVGGTGFGESAVRGQNRVADKGKR